MASHLGGVVTGAASAQEEVMRFFNSQTERGVYYGFDEHNELFPKGGAEDASQAAINRLPLYFRDYQIWTGATDGARTFTAYGGSAHSTFELGLPSGEEARLRPILPPTDEEARHVLHSCPSFHLPPRLLRTLDGSQE